MVQEQSCLPDDLFLLLMALHTRWLVAAEFQSLSISHGVSSLSVSPGRVQISLLL